MKLFCIEEWNILEPKKYFKNFEAKISLCNEINEERLNEYNLKEIRKNTYNEIEKENKNKIKKEKKLKRIFNEKILKIFKNRELRQLKRDLKKLPKDYDMKIAKEKDGAQKQLLEINNANKINEINAKLISIPKMTLFKYLKYYLGNEIKKIEEEKEMKEIEKQFWDMKIEDKKNLIKWKLKKKKK